MSGPVRSILFVPGDNPTRMEKAARSGADAIVIDLEDAVAPSRKAEARTLTVKFLLSFDNLQGISLWVRINPVNTPEALEDLSAIMPGAPRVILLPKANGPEDVETLSRYLEAFEVRDGLERGATKVVVVATETAQATLNLMRYTTRHHPRLAGLTWGAEDLSTDIGAAAKTGVDGQLSLTYRIARSQMLLAAKAIGVEAIDTVYPDFRDIDGLYKASNASRREGFSGAFAIHPNQVATINEAYSPSEDELAHAAKVLEAFAANPGAGAVSLDGQMLDMPHLKQAQHLIAAAERLKKR